MTLNDTQNFKFLGIDRVSKNGEKADHMCPYILRLLSEYKETVGIGTHQKLRAHNTPGPGPESQKTPGHDEQSQLLTHNKKYGPLSFIAGLLYLARCARPDISFGVNFLARAVHRWTSMHDRYLKHLFSYTYPRRISLRVILLFALSVMLISLVICTPARAHLAIVYFSKIISQTLDFLSIGVLSCRFLLQALRRMPSWLPYIVPLCVLASPCNLC